MLISAISHMDSFVSPSGLSSPSRRQRPLLVELAGVAGAGKSALSRALHRRDPAVRAGFLFDVPVRFDTDYLEVDLSAFAAGSVPRIPLVEIKP